MSERVWNPNVNDLRNYILELEMKLAQAERERTSLKAELARIHQALETIFKTASQWP